MAITPKPSGNIVDYFEGSTITTHSKTTGNWIGLDIVNDGSSDLQFTVNSLPITVKANETFSGDFADFNSISIDTAVAYRLTLRA
jgi:hypothetical protein